jgi:hypothetical protein
VANQWVKAKQFFTAEDDGLAQPWHGTVWLNPPFSQWELWAPKILHEWGRGEITEMCVLSATRTMSAQYFHRFLQSVDAMCITFGRIRFLGLGKQPDEGHTIYYMGDHRERFREVFAGVGAVFYAPHAQGGLT